MRGGLSALTHQYSFDVEKATAMITEYKVLALCIFPPALLAAHRAVQAWRAKHNIDHLADELPKRAEILRRVVPNAFHGRSRSCQDLGRDGFHSVFVTGFDKGGHPLYIGMLLVRVSHCVWLLLTFLSVSICSQRKPARSTRRPCWRRRATTKFSGATSGATSTRPAGQHGPFLPAFFFLLWSQRRAQLVACRAEESSKKLGKVIDSYVNILDLKGNYEPPMSRSPVSCLLSLGGLMLFLVLVSFRRRPGPRAPQADEIHQNALGNRPVSSQLLAYSLAVIG